VRVGHFVVVAVILVSHDMYHTAHAALGPRAARRGRCSHVPWGVPRWPPSLDGDVLFTTPRREAKEEPKPIAAVHDELHLVVGMPVKTRTASLQTQARFRASGATRLPDSTVRRP
jgi:hypothetical protein